MKYEIAKPDLTGNEKKYIFEAIEKNEVSWHGKFCDLFEEGFAKRHGRKYGVGTTSGTTALALAVAALSIGEGDEVIVPEFTMVATAWAVTYNKATPVFVDCDDNLLIDADKIEAKITKRTKAIIPVHIFGRIANMDAIMKIAAKYNLRVIEDAALAHGHKPSGDIACYAFFANKILTSGEGGICITDNPYLEERLRYLKNMAFDPNHTFLHKELGFNYRLTNFQAAILCAQLERLDEFLAKRAQIEEWYDEAFKNIKQITIMPKRKMLWVYDILVPEEHKDDLMVYLKKNEIDTRHYFKPMSMQPMYYNGIHPAGIEKEYEKLNAHKFSKRGFYLPTYTSLTKEDVQHIAGKVADFFAAADRNR